MKLTYVALALVALLAGCKPYARIERIDDNQVTCWRVQDNTYPPRNWNCQDKRPTPAARAPS